MTTLLNTALFKLLHHFTLLARVFSPFCVHWEMATSSSEQTSSVPIDAQLAPPTLEHKSVYTMKSGNSICISSLAECLHNVNFLRVCERFRTGFAIYDNEAEFTNEMFVFLQACIKEVHRGMEAAENGTIIELNRHRGKMETLYWTQDKIDFRQHIFGAKEWDELAHVRGYKDALDDNLKSITATNSKENQLEVPAQERQSSVTNNEHPTATASPTELTPQVRFPLSSRKGRSFMPTIGHDIRLSFVSFQFEALCAI